MYTSISLTITLLASSASGRSHRLRAVEDSEVGTVDFGKKKKKKKPQVSSSTYVS